MTGHYPPRHRRPPLLTLRQALVIVESVTGYTGIAAAFAAAITGDHTLIGRAAALLGASIAVAFVSWIAYGRTPRETP